LYPLLQWHLKTSQEGHSLYEFESIKVIGPETAAMLLSELKSVKKIKEAPKELIEDIIGKAKAKLVLDYFGRV
jgi:excinuclease UvrABC nuclease subunit